MNQEILRNDLTDITSNTTVPWDELQGKNILITGGNGMLASYMIETILYLNDHVFEEKSTVICLSRNKEKTLNRFKNYVNRDYLNFIFQDVCDPVLYQGTLDYIIHAASQASPKYYGKDPVGTLEANVIGTRNLLNLARKKDVRSFLFVSTSEVYGAIDTPENGITETDYGYLDPATVRACYGEGKRLGETMCVAYHYQHSVPVKMVRTFHTYGPSMRLDDGRVYADFVTNILNNEDIHLNSDGSAKRVFCYITDATIAFFLILLKGENANAYNLGNPEQEVSIFELAQILASLYPEKKIKVTRFKTQEKTGYLQSTVNRNFPNIEKLKSLGWTPHISINEGFYRTIKGLS